MSISGEWEGKLLDASGPMARVRANLKYSRGRVGGRFDVYFESARGPCDTTDWRHALTAPVTGSYDKAKKRLKLSYSLKMGPKPTVVAFDATIKPADPHARSALVGKYSVGEHQDVGLEGGRCVLWLYRN